MTKEYGLDLAIKLPDPKFEKLQALNQRVTMLVGQEPTASGYGFGHVRDYQFESMTEQAAKTAKDTLVADDTDDDPID